MISLTGLTIVESNPNCIQKTTMADSSANKETENIHIAVQGCCHGELEKIYESVMYIQNQKGKKVDLLICCGDFQAVRDKVDLESMAVPPKYRSMGVFHEYYKGTKTAPVLTIFVGGNHEASNHLWELPFGGWVAPNIYYLGYAGVVQFGGLRIGGISGIYKDHDYYKGHFEMPQFNESTKRTIYHTRSYEVFKLKSLKEHVDVFISHDWPQKIYNHGNVEKLLKLKSFFRKEVEDNSLGSPAGEELLKWLKPSYWFAAHLHVKFPALVEHEKGDDSSEDKVTKFLALDKCLPHRDFLQVLDLGPAKGEKKLNYDAEWLSVTKSTYPIYNPTSRPTWIPRDKDELIKYEATEEQLQEINDKFDNDLTIPLNFQMSQITKSKAGKINNQTVELCEKLGIENPCKISIVRKTEKYSQPVKVAAQKDASSDIDSSSSDDFHDIPKFSGDPSEISLDDSDDDTSEQSSSSFATKSSEVESHAESDLKRKLSSDDLSDESKPKPTFFVRRNKALYASLDDDNSGSSSSDCL